MQSLTKRAARTVVHPSFCAARFNSSVGIALSALALISSSALALEPGEILVLANKDLTASVRLAQYYCEARNVPKGNIVHVELGVQLNDWISRSDYEARLAGPVRAQWLQRDDAAKIRCLVTTYGVAYKVGRRGPIPQLEGRLAELRRLVQQERTAISELEQAKRTETVEYKQRKHRVDLLQREMDRISGVETEASVDSELSMVLAGEYDLYRWQPNALRMSPQPVTRPTLMVSRLDGPDYSVAKGLIDKAIRAEKTDLKGFAYVDSRGIRARDHYGHYDQSLRDFALLTRLRTSLQTVEEQTEQLFGVGQCPQTALYCGWYSLKRYVDAFDFVDGAVGYHIASFEAMHLRDPNSTEWCVSMLRDGITATLGAVREPYLHSFPEPERFFARLFDGKCLVEAFYQSKPFNSWQLVLIGDPLYRPFRER